MTIPNRQLAIAVSIAVLGAAFGGPAGAQFAGGRAAFEGRARPETVQFHDFFRNPWGGGGGYYQPAPSFDPYSPFYPRPQRPAESIKPPAPHKAETPPTQTIVVIGDSLADWLGYGLEEAFADTPEIGVVRKIKPYSGLVRYEARPDSPDWSQAVKDALAAEKPAAIVIMLGVNDRLPLRERAAAAKSATPSPPGQPATPAASSAADTTRPDNEQPAIAGNDAPRRPGAAYEFHTDQWAELYIKRIDEMIAVLKAKGVPVLWVGMPAVRGAKSTSDMSYLDELFRARAEKAGIVYVDIWDGFVDERGNYAQQGPDFEGQTRRLRTYDGVHFTKAGAEKLAHYVERDLRRLLTNRVLPVALPGPEEQTPKGSARPSVGPIVPLNVIGSGEGGDLLGAANHPAQHENDPIATQVLSRGEPIAAPPGRADDFSWPRTDASGPADVAPAAPPAPPSSAKGAPAKKDANKNDAGKNDTGKNDTGKNDTSKNDAKSDANKSAAPAPAPKVAPAKPRQTRDDLDGGPPRPPAPVGAAVSNPR
jgi:uncharacterized protein